MARVDHAVSLVQAYLQLNGYFTSAEYPIIASAGRSGVRTITDIDVLAFRFPRGLPLANPSRKRSPQGLNISDIDPGLGVPDDTIDMIIGEVKEGRVGVNTGVRDPEVLNVVIGRLGDSAQQLTNDAIVFLPDHDAAGQRRCVSLGHVLEFLQSYVRRHWHVLRHLQFKDPAFGFLMTLEKARRGGAGRRGEGGVEVVQSTEPRRRHDMAPRHVHRYGRGRRK
jgi:hypothetical protein